MSVSEKPIYIQQVRRGAPSSEAPTGIAYEIETTIFSNAPNYSGDQQDCTTLLNLFVNNIVSENDPSQDSFSNYATLADLDLVHPSREVAITVKANQYRDNVNIISFDNLSVAITAAQVVRDTINNIVNTYLRLKNSFMGLSTQYFPYEEELPSLRDTYIKDYQLLRDARVVAEGDQASKQTTYNNLLESELILRPAKEVICSLKDKLGTLTVLGHQIGAKYNSTLLALINELKSDNVLTTDVTTQLEAWLSDSSNTVAGIIDFDSSYTAPSGDNGYTLLGTLLQANQEALTECANYSQKLSSLELNLTQALSDLKESQTNKSNAASLEEAALSVLTSYCPSLDPSSI